MRIVGLLLILFLLSQKSQGQADLSSFFEKLDKIIAQKERFENGRQQEIRQLKDTIRLNPTDKSIDKFNSLNRLLECYLITNHDSATNCAQKMIELSKMSSNDSLLAVANLRYAITLLSGGYFKEAEDSFNKLKFNSLSNSNKSEFYYALCRLNLETTNNYHNAELRAKYHQLAILNVEKAITYTVPNTIQYLSLQALNSTLNNNFEQAIEWFKKIFNEKPPQGRLFAINASTFAHALENVGKKDDALKWYILAAIEDIKLANKENLALFRLAERLYAKGDIEKSAFYIETALKDAKTYGAIHRSYQISLIQPIIDQAKIGAIEKQKESLKFYALTLLALTLLIIGLLILTATQLKKVRMAKNQTQYANAALKEVNEKLTEINLIKETYIGIFFKTNSALIERMDEFRQQIENRINQKRFSEMDKIITRKLIKEEREKLFSSFDEAFLMIFPQFIEHYNALFKPEDRVTPENPKELTTDMRIFALIRLGIKDPEKIAHTLNYSVNTINTYKTRIKNMSLVSNEEFENVILKIQSA